MHNPKAAWMRFHDYDNWFIFQFFLFPFPLSLLSKLVSFTKSLAKEMARYNIRANSVVPGFIDTPMTRAVPEKVKEKMLQKIYLNRLGTSQDIADLVCFLSSEKAKYITGEAIECSGLIEL